MDGLIQLLPVRHGDCILVTFWETGNPKAYRLLIDTGFSSTYRRTLRPILNHLRANGEAIDLLILTHTDSDHIGGMKPLLAEFGTDWFETAWFNYAPHPLRLADVDGAISIQQGIAVRDLLANKGKLVPGPIATPYQQTLGPALLQVLSPDLAQFQSFVDEWRKQEANEPIMDEISAGVSDHHRPIESLVSVPFEPDRSWSNRSSIAFLLTLGRATLLLTADAHPDVLVHSLQTLGYSSQSPLVLQFMQVPHHGSKGNTSDALMQLIDCRHFVVSTNASNRHQFPHKETLARIIHTQRQTGEPIHFYFTYEEPQLHELFSSAEQDRYQLVCHFPTHETEGLQLMFSGYEYPSQ